MPINGVTRRALSEIEDKKKKLKGKALGDALFAEILEDSTEKYNKKNKER